LAFLNFSRKIYCKNYNEVLIHLGVIWRKGRGRIEGWKEGLESIERRRVENYKSFSCYIKIQNNLEWISL